MECDFAVVDKKELEKKPSVKDVLIATWIVDYDAMSDEEKKIYDELDHEFLDEDT